MIPILVAYHEFLDTISLLHARTTTGRNLTPKTFEELDDATFAEQFRFEKADIPELVRRFEFPAIITLDNRSRVDSRLAFCFLLAKLAYPKRLCDLEEFFGITRTIISRTLSYMVVRITTENAHLLKIRKCICDQYLEQWKVAMQNAGSPLPNCWAFIDGTCKQVCRPKYYQRLLYNGHKRYHCLKYQGLIVPSGILIDLAGPFIGIRHDVRILGESDLRSRLNHCMDRSNVIFGDPAYDLQDFFICPYEYTREQSPEAAFNQQMASVRVSVEWAFGRVIRLFTALAYGKQWQVLKQPVGKYYQVAVILTNVHCCIYGNQISDYFQDTMSVDDYFHYCNQCEA